MKDLRLTKQVILLLLMITVSSLRAQKKTFVISMFTLLFIVTLSSCTKKSGCADIGSDYDYHTGYFTYFDDKITINGIHEKTAKVNAVFIDDNCYPSCTTGVSKRSIPLNFRNNGEEIHVAISGRLKQPNLNDYMLETFVYDLDCIEKID